MHRQESGCASTMFLCRIVSTSKKNVIMVFAKCIFMVLVKKILLSYRKKGDIVMFTRIEEKEILYKI